MKIKRYDSLKKAPEGYYIYDQAPEVLMSWYTGPYECHFSAHVAREKRVEESGIFSTSIPMVVYHYKGMEK